MVAVVGLILSLWSCTNSERYIPNDTPPVDIPIVRFDSVLLHYPTDSAGLRQALKQTAETDPYTLHLFAENVIGVDGDDIEAIATELAAFLTDTVYGFKQVCEDTKQEFEDISVLRKKLNSSFGRLRYLYPDMPLPTLYIMVTGFQFGTLQLGDVSAPIYVIGADMYLGQDYPYYNGIVYEYQKKHMQKEAIVNLLLLSTIYDICPHKGDQGRLLDAILYEGRVRYLMQQLVPGRKPAYIMGYTDEEWAWCEKHEQQIWGLICDKQDLFSTQPLTISGYTHNGPFTSEISQESPAQLGIWIGWHIINAYMQQHPDMSLQEMMALTDAQTILKESKYKP